MLQVIPILNSYFAMRYFLGLCPLWLRPNITKKIKRYGYGVFLSSMINTRTKHAYFTNVSQQFKTKLLFMCYTLLKLAGPTWRPHLKALQYFASIRSVLLLLSVRSTPHCTVCRGVLFTAPPISVKKTVYSQMLNLVNPNFSRQYASLYCL